MGLCRPTPPALKGPTPILDLVFRPLFATNTADFGSARTAWIRDLLSVSCHGLRFVGYFMKKLLKHDALTVFLLWTPSHNQPFNDCWP